jgi:hypothetical protein
MESVWSLIHLGMACHFKSCRRIAPATTMVVIVLPKWARFNTTTSQWKLYQEFHARMQLFTRMSVADPTQHEVVALSPWHVELWLVEANCDLRFSPDFKS